MATIYRVRKVWPDASSQQGAFSVWENAVKCADQNNCSVFNQYGSNLYCADKTVDIWRVRKTWADHDSQVGASINLTLAKGIADKHPGYTVFDKNGKAVYKLVEKTPNQKAVEAAAEWAKKIAADNKYSYGTGKRAHRYGCPFCGTNLKKKGKTKVNGHSYANTYCCNPFVHAAYAHGAGDATMLKACKAGSGVGLSESTFTRYGNWKKIAKPKKSDLKVGDCLLIKGSHVCIYVGGGKVSHAKREGWDAGSITTEALTDAAYKKYDFVMRYTGKGKF